jgi:FKBP-type peptidyl-prolyl cis-trans isomerase 2
MRVHEVQDKTIVVDFNHRWLNFDMKVTDIKAAEERSTPALCIASNKKTRSGSSTAGPQYASY